MPRMIKRELIRQVWVVQDVTYDVPDHIQIEGDNTRHWIMIIDGCRVTTEEAIRRNIGGIKIVRKSPEFVDLN